MYWESREEERVIKVSPGKCSDRQPDIRYFYFILIRDSSILHFGDEDQKCSIALVSILSQIGGKYQEELIKSGSVA